MEMKKLTSLQDIFPPYRAAICDLWGVLHNGVAAFPCAVAALRSIRRKKIPILLLSNSPRPSKVVRQQIEGFGVASDCYDAVLTSGDLAQQYVHSLPKTKSFYHLGPQRDYPVLEGLEHTQKKQIKDADVILCTGFFEDWSMKPENYSDILIGPATQKKIMICANPDFEVDIGNKRVLCAGALAAYYESLGGPVIWLGKPEKIAYEKCIGFFREKTAGKILKKEILAIGDNPKTDILGAWQMKLDSLFITDGLHGKTRADEREVKKLFSATEAYPTFFMKRLKW